MPKPFILMTTAEMKDYLIENRLLFSDERYATLTEWVDGCRAGNAIRDRRH